MIDGGKSKYPNLLTLLRHEAPKIYDLVNDLCLDGIFRSQKFENTFLMPSAALVKHMHELVEADRDNDAIDIMRSLILNGHFEPADFTKDAVIGTLQYGERVLADPEAVGKEISKSDKQVIFTKTGAPIVVVLNFAGKEAPKTKEGKSKPKSMVARVSGGVVDHDMLVVKKITQELIVPNDHKKTVKNFFKAVAAVLAVLSHDPERFARAKFYLAANPILAWFFLVLPGRSDSLVRAQDLKDLPWAAVSDFDIIMEAEKVDYEINRPLMLKIKEARASLVQFGDRGSVPKQIYAAYEGLLPKMREAHSVDPKMPLDLKVRMDELRFLFEDSIANWSDVSDTLAELGLVENYTQPKTRITLCSNSTYSSDLIKSMEAYQSGPMMFIKSPYFLYVPLTEEHEQRLMRALESQAGGAICGGDPRAVNSVVFRGGAARKKLAKKSAKAKKTKDAKLAALVRVLTKSQREQLKSML